MSHFQKQKGKLALSERKIYPRLLPQMVLMSSGSKLFADLDGVSVFAYFPGYISYGMQVGCSVLDPTSPLTLVSECWAEQTG